MQRSSAGVTRSRTTFVPRDEADRLKHAILGAGGIGGLVGGALARAGHPVTLILRRETAERHPDSLSITSRVLGDFEAPVRIATELADEVDVVWLTVKATQLADALPAVPAERLGDALVIPLLNGIDHMARLRGVYPPGNVVAGAIRVESERPAPGEIRQVSPFAAIEVAASGRAGSRVRPVAEEIRGTGLDCEVVDDEASMLWGKLAFLAPLALTTTARAAPLGVVRAEPAWQTRLRSCVAEVCHAAETQGAKIDQDATLSRLEAAPEGMRSSMQKDVEAGRTPELDAIGGPVIRLGRLKGFDVSTTEELVKMIGIRLRGV